MKKRLRCSGARWIIGSLVGICLCFLPGDAAFAQDAPQAAVEREAESTPELIMRAQRLLDAGEWKGSAEALREILSRQPRNRAARQVIIDVFMRLGRWDEAQQHLDVLLGQYPLEAEIRALAAAVSFRQNQFQEAIEQADQAIRLDNTPNEAYRIRALSYFMLAEYDRFQEALHRWIEVEPESGEARYHLGRYFYENQQFTEALEALEEATRLDPSHYRAFFFLGWCRQAGGDLEGAEASFRKSVELVEKQGVAYGWPFTDLGELLITKGEMEAGLGWLYRGVRNDPKLPYTHCRYAAALLKADGGSEIEEELNRAIQLDPGYGEAYYLLGRYYQKVGEVEKAKAALAEFQRLKENPQASLYGVRR